MLDGGAAAAAAARRARAERRVVHLARTTPGAGPVRWHVTAASVRSLVGVGTAVVQYAAAGGTWVAVVTDRRGSTLHELVPAAAVGDALRAVTFGLHRAATGFGSEAGIAASWSAARAGAQLLDERLLRPLARRIRDRALVVSPPSSLGEVPWSLLPSCRGRPVAVAPSLSAWCRAREREPARRSVLAVAGPGLAHAEPEAAAVAARYSRSRTLRGAAAGVAPVLAELRRCDVAHIAAHGRLRADNPLLSTLDLADGPLTGYDLERVEGLPATVVLPSCHAGRGAAPVADETLGLAWTLLAGGAIEVVAPLSAVPDRLTADLMLRLHERLARGASAPAALADVQADVDPGDPRAAATAAAFVAFGG